MSKNHNKAIFRIMLFSIAFILCVVNPSFGADQNIYLDNAGAGAGSIGDPYGAFSEINWTTGGANSIFDWVAAGHDVYINLKKGVTWREQLTVGTSGASGHPITIQSYGSGADPIVSGMREVTGWDVGGNWGGSLTETWGENSTDDYTSVVEDTYLDEYAPTTNRSTDTKLSMQHSAGYGKRPLLRFDISAIPDTATVNTAVFKPTICQDGGAASIYIHKVLQTNWVINQVTWNIYSTGNNWNTAGCSGDGTDVDGTVESSTGEIASITIAAEDVVGTVKTSTDFAATVQNALSGNSLEILISTPTNLNNGFDSSNSSTDGERPYLEINYTPADAWVIDLAAPGPYRLVIDGTEYLEAETVNDIDATHRWFYDSGNTDLYIYATENPATAYSSMYRSHQWYNGILMDGKSYIIIQDLEIQGGAFSIDIKNASSNILIHDCTIGQYAVYFGIRVIGVTGAPYTQITGVEIYTCTIDGDYHNSADDYSNNVATDGIHFGASVASCKIYNNTFEDWTHSCMQIENISASCETQLNEIYENSMDTTNTNYCRGIGISSAGTDGQVAYNKIYRNFISNTTVRNQIHGNHNDFYCNVIETVTQGALAAGVPDGIGLFASGSNICHDNKIYSNVIYGVAHNGICLYGEAGYGNVQGNLVQNNIIMNWGTGKYGISMTDHATVLDNTYQNNLLYKSGVTDVVYYGHDGADDYPHTIAEFNAENGTASDVIGNNISSDPLMTDPGAGDFTLSVQSPCIDAGTNLGATYDDALKPGSTWPSSVNTDDQDYDGRWDIGAYRYLKYGGE